ncbi:MAG: tetratricopeptide repeat protein [Cyanobacteria bacterium J06628_4]
MGIRRFFVLGTTLLYGGLNLLIPARLQAHTSSFLGVTSSSQEFSKSVLDRLSVSSIPIAQSSEPAGMPSEALLRQALTIVNSLEINDVEAARSKISQLQSLAVAYGELKQIDQGQAIVEQAIAIANGPVFENVRPSRRLSTLLDLAVLHGTLNPNERTFSILENIADTVSGATGGPSESDVSSLKRVAIAYGQFGHQDKSLQLLQQALAIAYTNQWYWLWTDSLTDIAAIHIQQQDQDPAIAAINQALQPENIAFADVSDTEDASTEETVVYAQDTPPIGYPGFQPNSEQVRYLSNLANTIGQLEINEQSLALLEQVYTQANELDIRLVGFKPFEEIAIAAHQLGQPNLSQQIFENALGVALNTDDWNQLEFLGDSGEFARGHILQQILTAATNLKDSNLMKLVLKQTLTEVTTTLDGIIPSYKLQEFANIYSSVEQYDGARILLDKTLDKAETRTFTRPSYQTKSLVEIAIAYSQFDQTKSQTILQQALTLVDDSIRLFRTDVSAMVDIAKATVYLDDSEQIAAILTHLMEMAETIKSPNSRATVLGAIAYGYNSLGEHDIAQELLENALGLTAPIYTAIPQPPVSSRDINLSPSTRQGSRSASPNPTIIRHSGRNATPTPSPDALGFIIYVTGQFDQVERTQIILNQALETTNRIQHPQIQADSLRQVDTTMTSWRSSQ